jgi:hypothetical protein
MFDELIECRSLDFSFADQCSELAHCFWSYEDRLCHHNERYTDVESGVFSGSMVLGGLGGSLAIGYIVIKLARRKLYCVDWVQCLSPFSFTFPIHDVDTTTKLLNDVGVPQLRGIASFISWYSMKGLLGGWGDHVVCPVTYRLQCRI